MPLIIDRKANDSCLPPRCLPQGPPSPRRRSRRLDQHVVIVGVRCQSVVKLKSRSHRCGYMAARRSGHPQTCGLVDPDNVGAACPGVGVVDGGRAVGGDEAGAVLRQERQDLFDVDTWECDQSELTNTSKAAMFRPFGCRAHLLTEEQPGPPVSQTMKGSVAGSERDSKNQ